MRPRPPNGVPFTARAHGLVTSARREVRTALLCERERTFLGVIGCHDVACVRRLVLERCVLGDLVLLGPMITIRGGNSLSFFATASGGRIVIDDAIVLATPVH